MRFNRYQPVWECEYCKKEFPVCGFDDHFCEGKLKTMADMLKFIRTIPEDTKINVKLTETSMVIDLVN
uniref:Uncharacterized protein n=1 Tax=viral metagenome TaxID=1070528 RepID=A0A6M3LWC2_9ZZZZ